MKVKLGEVISEYSVRNRSSKDFPVYSVTNTQGFCTGYFSKEIASKDKSTYKIVPKGYFAYNPSRINVGSIDWQRNEDSVIVSPLYVVFGVSNQIDQQYLLYYLKSDMMLSLIKGYASGSVRDNLKFSELSKLPINIFPIDEQRQIVEILDKVVDLISKYNQQLEGLDQLIKSRFIEMFGDPVTNTLGWKVQTLTTLCEKLTDGTHHSPQSYESGTYLYITAKNIKENGFDLTNITYVDSDTHNEIFARCNPELGDVLYIKDGVTTGVAMVNTLQEPFSMLSSVALLKQNRKVVNGTYLCGVLNNKDMYNFVRSGMGGAAITRLTIEKLKKIRIPVPPLVLQNQFADFVVQVDKSKLAVQQSIEKLETLKKSLMQEYFS